MGLKILKNRLYHGASNDAPCRLLCGLSDLRVEGKIVGCGFNRTDYILMHQTMHPTNFDTKIGGGLLWLAITFTPSRLRLLGN